MKKGSWFYLELKLLPFLLELNLFGFRFEKIILEGKRPLVDVKFPTQKLRTIPVRLIFNDPDLNLRAEYSMFDLSNGASSLCGEW